MVEQDKERQVTVYPLRLVVYSSFALLTCRKSGAERATVPLRLSRVEQFRQYLGGSVVVLPAIWEQERGGFTFESIEHSRTVVIAVLHDAMRGGLREVPITDQIARDIRPHIGATVAVDIHVARSEVAGDA